MLSLSRGVTTYVIPSIRLISIFLFFFIYWPVSFHFAYWLNCYEYTQDGTYNGLSLTDHVQVCQNAKLGWKHHASLDTPKELLPPSHIFRVPLRGQPICRRYYLLLTHPLQVLLSRNSYLVALDSPEQVNSLSGSRPITFVPRSAKLLP